MAGASGEYHEPFDQLRDDTKDLHRALVSLQEELEAVDWYQQRVDAAQDPELKRILAHNRDEEKEHAMMVLEWLRRRDPAFDEHMRTYLFTSGDITELEEAETDGDTGNAASSTPRSGLTIGGLTRDEGGAV